MEACELYKIIRPSPDAIVPFTGDASLPSSAFSQSEASGDDLKEVLKDIRHQLRQIWSKLPDGKSRKRAVMRLVKKWHPDKNLGKEELSTQVFQAIKHYARLLESGQDLPSDSDDDVESYGPDDYGGRHGTSSGGGGGGGGWFGSFFDDVFSRVRTDAQRSRGHGGSSSAFCGSWFTSSWSSSPSSSSFRSRANPQPVEGRRWMRQARQDLVAARGTLTLGACGVYNWACYQAHQVPCSPSSSSSFL